MHVFILYLICSWRCIWSRINRS